MIYHVSHFLKFVWFLYGLVLKVIREQDVINPALLIFAQLFV